MNVSLPGAMVILATIEDATLIASLGSVLGQRLSSLSQVIRPRTGNGARRDMRRGGTLPVVGQIEQVTGPAGNAPSTFRGSIR